MAKKKDEVILATNGDDWEGLYVNGKLVTEDHKIRLQDLAVALKLNFKRVEFNSDWLLHKMGGGLPEDVKDLKISE